MQISVSIYGIILLTIVILVLQSPARTLSGTESTPSRIDATKVSMGT